MLLNGDTELGKRTLYNNGADLKKRVLYNMSRATCKTKTYIVLYVT